MIKKLTISGIIVTALTIHSIANAETSASGLGRLVVSNDGDKTRILLEDYYVDFAVTKKTDKGLQVTGGILLEDFLKETGDPFPPFTKTYASIAGGLGKLEFSNQDDASSLSGYANDLAPGGYGIDGFSSLANAGKINAYGKTDIEIPAGLIRINYTTPKIRGFTLGFSVAKSVTNSDSKPDPESRKNTIIFDFDSFNVATITETRGTFIEEPIVLGLLGNTLLDGGSFKLATPTNFDASARGTRAKKKTAMVTEEEEGPIAMGGSTSMYNIATTHLPLSGAPAGTVYKRTITRDTFIGNYPNASNVSLSGKLTGGVFKRNSDFTSSGKSIVTATILPARKLADPAYTTSPPPIIKADEVEVSLSFPVSSGNGTKITIEGTTLTQYYIVPANGDPIINGYITTMSDHFSSKRSEGQVRSGGTATKTETKRYDAGTKQAIEGLRALRATDSLIVNRINSIKAEIAEDVAGTEVKARTADYSANSIGFNYHFANFNFGAAITNYEKTKNVQLYDDAVIGGQHGGAFTTEAAAIKTAVRSINGKYSAGWVGRRSHISYQNNWMGLAYSATKKIMAVSEIAGTKDAAARDTLAEKADADNVNETIVLSFNYGSGQLGYSTQSEDYLDPKDPTEIAISMVHALTVNHNITEHIALYGRHMIGEAELDPLEEGFEESVETQAGITIAF